MSSSQSDILTQPARSHHGCCRRAVPKRGVHGNVFRHDEAPLLYDMYTVPVCTFLSLDKLLHHQEMIRNELLTPWSEAMNGKVIFVSHEWLGFQHADPDGVHFHALKRILTRLAAGNIAKVESSVLQQIFSSNVVVTAAQWVAEIPDMYVWYDWASIPQLGVRGSDADVAHLSDSDSADSLARAVDSIPAYVERSAIILVLAPLVTHLDRRELCSYSTWRNRGWCRLELWAALLSRRTPRVMICKGAEVVPEFIMPVDILLLPAAEGNFTCCRLGHRLQGVEIECDKSKVLRVINTMLQSKVAALRAEGRCDEMRYYLTTERWIFRGCGAGFNSAGMHAMSLDAFCTHLMWSAEDSISGVATGRTLLFYAAMAGQAEALCHMLSRHPCYLDLPLRSPILTMAESNLTPLLTAMVYANFDIVALLLDARADPMYKIAAGSDAFNLALSAANLDNARSWLVRFPQYDINQRFGPMSDTCWMALSISPAPATVAEILLHARASIDKTSDLGTTALHYTCFTDRSSPETVSLLIEARADVNARLVQTTVACRAMLAAARFAVRRGHAGSLLVTMARWGGWTPLAAATVMGKVDEVRLLLAARADPSIANYQGRNTLDIAAVYYGGAVPSVLRDVFEPCEMAVRTLLQIAGTCFVDDPVPDEGGAASIFIDVCDNVQLGVLDVVV